MNVSFQYSVLTWVPDLTDPASLPIPVAVVAVAETSPESVLVFLGAETVKPGGPRDSFGILDDLARFLGRNIEKGLSETDPSRLLAWLQERFNQSFAFWPTRSERLALADADPNGALVTEFLRIYRQAVTPTSSDTLPAVPTMHVQSIARHA